MAARLTVLDVSAMIRIGASAGLTLRYVGLAGMFGGSWPAAAAMAACTSRAAPLMSRARSNCRVMVVAPRNDVDVISVTPAMRPNWRSSGVASADAIVSGLAPGRPAETWIVGNSTWGRGETGRNWYARMPESATASVRSVVAIGLSMKGVERLMAPAPASGAPEKQAARSSDQGDSCILAGAEPVRAERTGSAGKRALARSPACEAPAEAVEGQVDHRGRVERQD